MLARILVKDRVQGIQMLKDTIMELPDDLAKKLAAEGKVRLLGKQKITNIGSAGADVPAGGHLLVKNVVGHG